jgi:hypothetical protein
MAKLKYDPEATPLNKEHYGYTFQRNNYGFSMFPAQKNDRKRYPLQWEKMQYMSKAIRNWRNQSIEIQEAWETFADTYPQPTEKDPDTYLTGYQLFLKRYFYYFIHEGITADFNLYPELDELPVPEFSVRLIEAGPCIDVTEEYIRNHGILPQVGQFVICRIIPISANSAQFFAPLVATLEVEAVYLDGLVLSFDFSANFDNIVFSLYLSKPVWESVQYPGTKFRYMGCFKPTKFIQLSDTPESYEGQAGKIVKVNEAEDAVIFDDAAGCDYCLPTPTEADAGKVVTVNSAGDGYTNEEAGGGSFNCDDLLECDVFTVLQEQVHNISEIVVVSNNTSIPPVNFGLLYNKSAAIANSNFLQTGWRLPTYSEMLNWINANDSTSTAGGKMKETGFIGWEPPNDSASNLWLFNGRGGGLRNGSNGLFYDFKRYGRFWTQEILAKIYLRYFSLSYSWPSITFHYWVPNYGMSLRPVRENASLSDGQSGFYLGNNNRYYRTIKFMNLEWLADNLAETLNNDGSQIPEITSDSEWVSATTPALCAFNNNWNNV